MNTRLITLTNDGYKLIASNMMKSLSKLNLIGSLTVFCLDQKVLDYLKNLYPICKYILIENTGSENLIDFRRAGWNHIVFYKMKAIYNSLNEYDRVLFIDGDIVFYRNPLEELEQELGDKDILFQTDLIISNEYYNQYFKDIENLKNLQGLVDFMNGNKNIKSEVNTGFIYIKNTQNNIDFFDYKNIDINTFSCDQIYVNDNLNKLNYKMLNAIKYPTGLFIKSLYFTILKSMPADLGYLHNIIHFNYTIASLDKVATIKAMHSWDV
jgi:hypothetical protein